MRIFIYVTDKILNGQFGCYETRVATVTNRKEYYESIETLCEILYERHITTYFGYSFEQFKKELFQYKTWKTIETFSEKEIEQGFEMESIGDFCFHYCFPHEEMESRHLFKSTKYFGVIKTSYDISKNIVIEMENEDELEKLFTPAALTLYKDSEVLQKELSLKEFSRNWYYIAYPLKEKLQNTSAQALQKVVDNLEEEVVIDLLCNKR